MRFWCFWILFVIANIQGEQQARHFSWRDFHLIETRQLLLKNQRHLELINYLIATRNYKTYLEIGVEEGYNFRYVVAAYKCGVDPFPRCSCDFQMTSDQFFKINQQTFDIIFIDGMHLHEQVLRDVQNGLKCLNPGGVIVMHDCLPERPEHQSRTPVPPPGAWNGDVWKAAAYIRMHWQNVHLCVLDMDWGCGIVTPNATQILYPAIPIEQMDWDFYVNHREELLNMIKVEDWIKMVCEN